MISSPVGAATPRQKPSTSAPSRSSRRRTTSSTPRLAWPLASLGEFLVERGGHDRGLELLRRALLVDRRNWDDDHLATANTSARLASTMRSAGRLAAAESLYWNVLAIERDALGPRHPQTAGRLIDIGRLRVRRGDLTAAEEPLLEGLSIRRQGGGRGLTEAFLTVASLYRTRGEFERAEPLVREGLASLDSLPDTDALRRQLLRESLALYSDWGRLDDVERVRRLLAALDGTGGEPE